MRDLKDVLEKDFNLSLTGWKLINATSISDDGSVICGNGINPQGLTEAWVATIPEPATLLLLGFGGLFLSRRKK
jgi:hypothetical protein